MQSNTRKTRRSRQNGSTWVRNWLQTAVTFTRSLATKRAKRRSMLGIVAVLMPYKLITHALQDGTASQDHAQHHPGERLLLMSMQVWEELLDLLPPGFP